MGNNTWTLKATMVDKGKRLDQFLAKRTDTSRNQIQRFIRSGLVTINGNKGVAHYLVRPGDNIRLVRPEDEPRSPTQEPRIVEETDEYLVIDKPAGLLSHPTPHSAGETTLTDWLTDYLPNIVTVGEFGRPGLVHRLDRLVSGLLVVAKTPSAYEHFKNLFRSRQVLKVYLALVIGVVREEEGTIRFKIARSKTRRGRMAARPLSAAGREGVTTFRVLERYRTTTLLSVRILTGRTHQIRAHLFAKGFPILGDSLYRGRTTYRLPELGRPFLHATKLGFDDTYGQWCEFESPLPEDLEKIRKELKQAL